MRFVASMLLWNLPFKACQPPHVSIILHFQFPKEFFTISVTLIIISIKMLLKFVHRIFVVVILTLNFQTHIRRTKREAVAVARIFYHYYVLNERKIWHWIEFQQQRKKKRRPLSFQCIDINSVFFFLVLLPHKVFCHTINEFIQRIEVEGKHGISVREIIDSADIWTK